MGYQRQDGAGQQLATIVQQALWPDQTKPGFPLRPHQDGHHVIILKHHPGGFEVGRWTAATREWLLPGATLPKSCGWAAKFCSYVSPVRTNIELRAAYDRGMKDGRTAAMSTIADLQETAVRAAMRERDGEIEIARQEGARRMREMAADMATSMEISRPADHLGSFYDSDSLEKWHRRLYAAAIHDLPLPDEQSRF